MALRPPIRAAYTLAGIALTPALKLWLTRRAKRGKEDATRLGERFGHAGKPRPAGTLVWVHAASVGEAQSVLTLLRMLLDAQPDIHILITTGTVTSAALVAQQAMPRMIHQFVPVDTAPSVARFLEHWRPDLALWVESELWPQLVWQAHTRRIPMLLINARMSAKSEKNWQKWPATIRSLLGTFRAIYAGSTQDAQRLMALGATDVRDTGNLKYDAAPLPGDAQTLAMLQAQCTGRRVFVAASTHANEEQKIAAMHAAVAQHIPTLLTIIIPRHAMRGDAIAADLRARGAVLAQRSKHEPITTQTAIYLADTMGELGSFYRLGALVFLGGSLIAHGGQNPLEPARLGNALITGPHIHNFTTIMQHLEQAGAIRMVADSDALAHSVIDLLGDATAQRDLAERAAQAVATAGGASATIAQHCARLLHAEGA